LATCRLTDGAAGVCVRLQFDRWFRELVVYRPPRRRAICLEPYTCATDAINLVARGIDTGLHVLEPGGAAEGRFAIRAEAYREP
ncbi:MAG: hypothetical protein ACOC46_03455, partial [Pirellulales bacterium]